MAGLLPRGRAQDQASTAVDAQELAVDEPMGAIDSAHHRGDTVLPRHDGRVDASACACIQETSLRAGCSSNIVLSLTW